MNRDEFLRALREADQNLQRDLSAEADSRLRGRILREPARRLDGWGFRALVAAVAVMVLLWLYSLMDFRPRVGEPTGFPLGLEIAGAPGETLSLPEQGFVFTFVGKSRNALRREGRHVRVLRGAVTVDASRRPMRQAQILVSHGAIQVVGTRFTVEQEAERGSVTLHHGEIVFRSDSGAERRIRSGNSLSWPLVDSAPPPPAVEEEPAVQDPPQEKRKPRRKLSRVEIAEVLQSVARLRAQQRYGEAIRELRRASKRVPDRSVRERFSFEIGSLMARAPGHGEACLHWARHLEEFGQGRYSDAIRRAQSQLGCSQ